MVKWENVLLLRKILTSDTYFYVVQVNKQIAEREKKNVTKYSYPVNL